MAYDIEGKLLEVCTCNVLCPCWVGEDPDGGTCDSALAWHIDSGSIEGVDVSGRTVALSVHIPGNVLVPKSWKGAVYLDDGTTDEQQGMLLKVFTGQAGGAIADLAGLIGEVVSVERVPITFTVEGGKGRLKVGNVADAEIQPYMGATGKPTVLSETVFSTVPGSPVYAAKSDYFTRDGSSHGVPSVNRKGNNALQGHFRFAA
ncbi:MAG TPA: DUF1326 domain-containing protein [Candidatus Limnocylindrales bacterium]|nr:DUF1326 domain-containing protein [Candidatus Limnocylindrales bacterium]